MFTGIIEETGRIKTLRLLGDTAKIEIQAAKILEGLQLGDSVAVNGVCLTVTRITTAGFDAEMSRETLSRTGFKDLPASSVVNLERALMPTSRLGGHFVQGHVDGVGNVIAIRKEQGFATFRFSLPDAIRRYVVEKGSIAINGISLTVAKLEAGSFEVALIPHTLGLTNLEQLKVGDRVNLECDILAKYVDALLKAAPDIQPAEQAGTQPASLLTVEYLKEQGF